MFHFCVDDTIIRFVDRWQVGVFLQLEPFHGVRVNSQDHGRLQVYTQQTTRELNSRDKVQQLCFTTSVLTTMKSQHFLGFGSSPCRN